MFEVEKKKIMERYRVNIFCFKITKRISHVFFLWQTQLSLNELCRLVKQSETKQFRIRTHQATNRQNVGGGGKRRTIRCNRAWRYGGGESGAGERSFGLIPRLMSGLDNKDLCFTLQRWWVCPQSERFSFLLLIRFVYKYGHKDMAALLIDRGAGVNKGSGVS